MKNKKILLFSIILILVIVCSAILLYLFRGNTDISADYPGSIQKAERLDDIPITYTYPVEGTEDLYDIPDWVDRSLIDDVAMHNACIASYLIRQYYDTEDLSYKLYYLNQIPNISVEYEGILPIYAKCLDREHDDIIIQYANSYTQGIGEIYVRVLDRPLF